MRPQPVFLDHGSSLSHATGDHPERAERLLVLSEELARHDYLGYQRVSSPAVDPAVLERVHPAPYVEQIAAIAAAGGGRLDADTVISQGSFEAALHAAGGAVELARRLVAGGSGQVGFSAHRPPGHHAAATAARGFCVFNNIAVAALHALEGLSLSRVMILDWDVHHGNGTSDIFWRSDRVLYISIHQWPLYPGTGSGSELGAGAGEGYTVNLPVPPGTGGTAYSSLVRDVVLPLGRAYQPQLMLISAGYDAHREDPLADCMLDDQAFATMATLMRGLALELGVGLGCVLEGGYAVHALARSVLATMEALSAPASIDASRARASAPVPSLPHHLAREALSRLEPYWPGIA